jgi:hypothetical protein
MNAAVGEVCGTMEKHHGSEAEHQVGRPLTTDHADDMMLSGAV